MNIELEDITRAIDDMNSPDPSIAQQATYTLNSLITDQIPLTFCISLIFTEDDKYIFYALVISYNILKTRWFQITDTDKDLMLSALTSISPIQPHHIFTQLVQTVSLFGILYWDKWDFPHELYQLYGESVPSYIVGVMENVAQLIKDENMFTKRDRIRLSNRFSECSPVFISIIISSSSNPEFAKPVLTIIETVFRYSSLRDIPTDSFLDIIYDNYLVNPETIDQAIECLESYFLTRSDPRLISHNFAPKLIRVFNTSRNPFNTSLPITTYPPAVSFIARFLKSYYYYFTKNAEIAGEVSDDIQMLTRAIIGAEFESIDEYWSFFGLVLRIDKSLVHPILAPLYELMREEFYTKLSTAFTFGKMESYSVQTSMISLARLDIEKMIESLSFKQIDTNYCYAVSIMERVFPDEYRQRTIADIYQQVSDGEMATATPEFSGALLYLFGKTSSFLEENPSAFEFVFEYVMSILESNDNDLIDTATNTLFILSKSTSNCFTADLINQINERVELIYTKLELVPGTRLYSIVAEWATSHMENFVNTISPIVNLLTEKIGSEDPEKAIKSIDGILPFLGENGYVCFGSLFDLLGTYAEVAIKGHNEIIGAIYKTMANILAVNSYDTVREHILELFSIMCRYPESRHFAYDPITIIMTSYKPACEFFYQIATDLIIPFVEDDFSEEEFTLLGSIGEVSHNFANYIQIFINGALSNSMNIVRSVFEALNSIIYNLGTDESVSFLNLFMDQLINLIVPSLIDYEGTSVFSTIVDSLRIVFAFVSQNPDLSAYAIQATTEALHQYDDSFDLEGISSFVSTAFDARSSPAVFYSLFKDLFIMIRQGKPIEVNEENINLFDSVWLDIGSKFIIPNVEGTNVEEGEEEKLLEDLSKFQI